LVVVADLPVPAQDPEEVLRRPGPGPDGGAGRVSHLYDLELTFQPNLPPLLPPSRPMPLKRRGPTMETRMRRKTTGRGTLLADVELGSSSTSRFSSSGPHPISQILLFITCRR
jgi:hypothetical protein